MQSQQLQQTVQPWFRPIDRSRLFHDRQTWFWLVLSLGVPLYFGSITLWYGLSQTYIVQDDARQHVVFLQRWVDPQLFPNDPIANYFTAMAPFGYQALYWLAAKLGLPPLLLAKILPPVLSLITTVYLFLICLFLFPIPIAGFLATLILNQHLWMNDDLVSATPRAFVYPIFTVFLYALLHRSLFSLMITIALQGLFFPQLVLVQLLVLLMRLFRWRPLRRSDCQTDYLFAVAGILVAALVLLPYGFQAEFGAAITAAAMQSLPEYGLAGRNEYFGVSPWQFWLWGNSGVRIPWFPSIILAGAGLPWLARSRSPLVQALHPEIGLLGQVLVASLALYSGAHLVLLKLHFPSRYTYHTLRMILAIAAGIVLAMVLDAGWRWLRYRRRVHPQLNLRERALLSLTASFALLVVVVPAVPQLFLPFQGWVVGEAPALYRYLAAQPRQTRIASLAQEANNLPAFTQKSILVGREFALPHHPEYYQIFRRQLIDLIHLQYTPNSSELVQLTDRYNLDFLLLERDSFQPTYLLSQDWLIHSSLQAVVRETVDQLNQGQPPALVQWIPHCQVLTTQQMILVDARCVRLEARRDARMTDSRSACQSDASCIN